MKKSPRKGGLSEPRERGKPPSDPDRARPRRWSRGCHWPSAPRLLSELDGSSARPSALAGTPLRLAERAPPGRPGSPCLGNTDRRQDSQRVCKFPFPHLQLCSQRIRCCCVPSTRRLATGFPLVSFALTLSHQHTAKYLPIVRLNEKPSIP